MNIPLRIFSESYMLLLDLSEAFDNLKKYTRKLFIQLDTENMCVGVFLQKLILHSDFG